MKIIHTSDWHLGKVLNDYSLLEDQRYWLQAFSKKMQQIKPDVIIIAGDIYDRSVPSAEAVSLLNETLYQLLRSLNCIILIIAGNHDSKERLCFGSELLEQSNLYLIGKTEASLKKVTVIDSYGPVNFYLLPYSNCYDIKEALSQTKTSSLSEATLELCRSMLDHLDSCQRNVFVAHGFFVPVYPENISDDRKVGIDGMISLIPFDSFDYIALGHIHMQKSAGLRQAFYSGSPLKYSVDEANQKKGILEIVLHEKGNTEIISHSIPTLRDVHIIKGTFDEIITSAQKNTTPSEDYVFFHLTDPIPVIDAVLKLKVYYPKILGLKFTELTSVLSTAENNLQKLQEKDSKTLFSEFYQQLTGQFMTEYQSSLSESILKDLEGHS